MRKSKEGNLHFISRSEPGKTKLKNIIVGDKKLKAISKDTQQKGRLLDGYIYLTSKREIERKKYLLVGRHVSASRGEAYVSVIVSVTSKKSLTNLSANKRDTGRIDGLWRQKREKHAILFSLLSLRARPSGLQRRHAPGKV